MAARAKKATAAEPKKGRGVDEQSPWIEQDEEAHDLARTLRAGVPALREAALEYRYLKPNPGDMELVEIGGGRSFSLYELRIDRSDSEDEWTNTIQDTARLPFRARIGLEGWDQALAGKTTVDAAGRVVHREKGWVDRVTAEGQTLDQYAAETFEDALFEGVVFSFVDNDPRRFPDAGSRRSAGAQPRVTKFRRCDVRRITVELRHDVPRLKQVVLVQPLPSIDVADPNNWTDAAEDARKVVTAGDPDAPKGSAEALVTTRIYVKDANGEWVERPLLRGVIRPDNPRDELREIPLVPHYAKRTGPWRGSSPFLNSAWTQQAIWVINSEVMGLAREVALTHIHESGVVTMTDPHGNVIPVLGDTRNARYHCSTLEGATLKVCEMEGSALKAVCELIDRKLAYIRRAHRQIQAAKPTGPVTAREITLEGVHASSALEMWVLFQEAAWQQILELMALLGGLEKRGVVSIPHDFGLPNTGMERNAQLFVADKMTAKNYWPEAIRAGDVDEKTFDLNAELAMEDKQQESSRLGLALLASSGGGEEEDEDAGEDEGEPPAGGNGSPPPARPAAEA